MSNLYICMIIMIALNPFFSKKSYKIYLGLMLFILVYFAYHVEITPTMDLYRRIEEMMLYRETSFTWFLENRMDSDPLGNLFFYFFSMFEDYRILPAFTIFTCYSCAFYILLKCADRYELSKGQMNWLLFVFVFCFYYDQALSNIRIYVGYAILSFFLYNDIIEGKYKKLAWIIYIASVFFHYALLVVLLPRLLLLFKNKLKISSVVIYAFMAVGLIFSDVLISQLSGLGGVFQTLADKSESYAEYDVFGKWQFLSSIIRIVLFMAISYLINLRMGEKQSNEKNVCFYMNCVNLMLLVMYNNYQLILRTPNFVHYLGMVALSVFFKAPETIKEREVSYSYLTLKFFLVVASIYTIGYQIIFIHPSVNFLR